MLFGLNIPDVGWVTAQNGSPAISATSTRCSPRRPSSSSNARGSAPSGPRRSPSGSPTTTTGGWSRSCAQLGLTFAADEGDRPSEGPLSGKQYVLTGTFESFSREQAKAALEALGAKVSDSVSKKTAAVFVGESPGSKVAKAEAAGVPTLGEDDLQALLAR